MSEPEYYVNKRENGTFAVTKVETYDHDENAVSSTETDIVSKSVIKTLFNQSGSALKETDSDE